MSTLSANPNIIVVDNPNGATIGASSISYEKEGEQELWEADPNGVGAKIINVHERTGLGDEANFHGHYSILLKPGQVYQVRIYEKDHGPGSNFGTILVESLSVSCVLKAPGALSFRDVTSLSGGTWHSHNFKTNTDTSIAFIGVSQKAPIFDKNGIPSLDNAEGAPVGPLDVAMVHLIEIKPLVPGNHYFFVMVVADASGNWQVVQHEFDTLRRKLTVEFRALHIYNDGDPFDVGEGEFLFRVVEGGEVVEEFNRPTTDIDDFSETDRPYPLGFVHLGPPKTIKLGLQEVSVQSFGIEHDGIFESDEHAGNFFVALPLPTGSSVETVTDSGFTMDCPPLSDDDFHYGVDVRWSVAFVV